MKSEAIAKVFGGQKLKSGIGTVLPLLYGLTQLNWEAAWPGIQKAMIGLGTASIAVLKGEAIQRGLTDLAGRIAAFEPTASPIPGGPLIPRVNMPYIPLSPTMRAQGYNEEGLKAQSLELQKTIERYREIPPPNKERCLKIQELRILVENLRRGAVFTYPALGPTHLISAYQTGWLDTCTVFDQWIDILGRKWGCPGTPGAMELGL